MALMTHRVLKPYRISIMSVIYVPLKSVIANPPMASWELMHLSTWFIITAYKWTAIYIYIYICMYVYIHTIYYGINETKQRDLEQVVSCLHNHSANL